MNPKRQSKISPVPARTDLSGWQPGHPGRDENGFIIIAVIALIAILALVATVAVITTTTEIKISSNYKTGVQAFHAAQAGAEEARARLRGPSDDNNYAGDTAANPDSTWVAYILTAATSWKPDDDDPDYDPAYTSLRYPELNNPDNTTKKDNSLQSDISYWVKIRHKRTADLVGSETPVDYGSASDIIYYGYGTSTSTTLKQFTTDGNPYMGSPVEIITSYGSSGSGSGIIEIQAIKLSGPPVVAALYGDTVDGAGNITIVGDDNNTCLPGSDSLPAVGYATSESFVGSPALISDAGESTQITPALELETQVDALADSATITLDDDDDPLQNYTEGSSSDYKIVYCHAEQLTDEVLSFQNIIGYGTLVVRGNVEFSGNLTWYGLIIASGSIEFAGGGTKNIYGAVMGEDVVQLVGTVNIKYDSCEIEKANGSYLYSTLRWEDKRLK